MDRGSPQRYQQRAARMAIPCWLSKEHRNLASFASLRLCVTISTALRYTSFVFDPRDFVHPLLFTLYSFLCFCCNNRGMYIQGVSGSTFGCCAAGSRNGAKALRFVAHSMEEACTSVKSIRCCVARCATSRSRKSGRAPKLWTMRRSFPKIGRASCRERV